MATATRTPIKTDSELKHDVEMELKWEPSVNANEIGVAVKDGVVTLSGFVDSYFERRQAEKAAERVGGVKAVVQQIEVKLPGSSKRTDLDLAKAATNALEWDVSVPRNSVKVKVEDGWITLEGDVNWQYQRMAAERAVRNLLGVKGVSNLISVRPAVTPTEIQSKIQDAFKRQASLDAGGVKVEVQGTKVILSGTVKSWTEKDAARRAAWAAPGVTDVVNNIVVIP